MLYTFIGIIIGIVFICLISKFMEWTDLSSNDWKKKITLMRIKVGHGTNGDIYADLEKVKACNYCVYFMGYGLHAVSGHCLILDKDIDGGYIGNYTKTAKECNVFDVKQELIEENNPYKD